MVDSKIEKKRAIEGSIANPFQQNNNSYYFIHEKFPNFKHFLKKPHLLSTPLHWSLSLCEFQWAQIMFKLQQLLIHPYLKIINIQLALHVCGFCRLNQLLIENVKENSVYIEHVHTFFFLTFLKQFRLTTIDLAIILY